MPKISGLTQNSRRLSGVFHFKKIPGVFQVFQVRGKPVISNLLGILNNFF